MDITLPWKIEDPCPCESGKPLRDCCLGPDGVPRIRIPSLIPPGPSTGYRNDRCYLNVTANCSQSISREHYISRSILDELGPLTFSGFPWDTPGTQITYGINSLTSHILCTRHNSALSPLDAIASKAFKAIRDSSLELARSSSPAGTRCFLISGQAVELWALKTICGLFYSSVAAEKKQRLNETYSIDVDRFATALNLQIIGEGCGLYVTSHVGPRNIISFGPLSVPESKKVIGIRIGFAALEVDVILDPTGVNFSYLNENFFHRPWVINLNNGQTTHMLFVTWPGSPIVSGG
jgi:hypothetical protein